MPRLLHFTDMHLRWHQPGSASQPERLSRDMPITLDRLTSAIRETAPDVLVLSGDVLDMPDEVVAGGTPDGRPVSVWRDEALADYRLVRDWFENTGVPYVVVPGNHDCYDTFAQVFGPIPEPADIAGLRFFCFWDDLSNIRQPLRKDSRKALFEEALTDPRHDCAQVHVQHYMIDPTVFAKGKPYQYETADTMKRQLARSGRVRAVLSGHYHPGSMVRTDGVIHSLPPAFCEAPHAFRIYDLTDDGECAVSDRALDD